MASFQSIVRDIKDIRIQGAANIAKAAVSALELVADRNKSRPRKDLLNMLFKAKSVLFQARPTEPMMRNSLNFILAHIEEEQEASEALKHRAEKFNQHFADAEKKIVEYTSRKISDNMVIFTHCHSSAVVNTLIYSKNHGKKFTVHNTETRPLFQGRKTAADLARHGIPVVHYIDSAARIALKKADLMLLGADAITSEGKVINKIGSEMFAEVAEKYDIPVYICTDSWKFDPLSIFGYEEEIEKRVPKEIWPYAPKGITISNLAFEKIDPKYISAIISELGVYKPSAFVEEVKKTYPWIIR
jgi:ribose 1,5-bisphosphate isomerase